MAPSTVGYSEIAIEKKMKDEIDKEEVGDYERKELYQKNKVVLTIDTHNDLVKLRKKLATILSP